MSLIRAPQQRFQPQGTGALNDAHPLRRYVKFAFLGSAGKHRDLTRHALTSGASATIVPSLAGVGLKSDATNTQLSKLLASNEVADFTGDITLIWHGVILGNLISGNDRFLDISFDNANGSPFVVASIYRPSGNNDSVTFATNNGSFQTANQAASLSSFYGRPVTIVASNAAGSSATRIIVRPIGGAPTNGAPTLSAAAGNPRGSSSTSTITIGGVPNGSNPPNATTTAALILNKAVSEQEANWISQNVWSFFSGPSRDIATSLMHAAGGANIQGGLTATLGDLTATSTGTVLVTGTAANTLGDLTVASAGTSGAAAQPVSGLTFLFGGLLGAASANRTGELNATLGALTSSSAGTVLVTGGLTQTLDALTSSSAGTVLVTGTLGVTLGDLTSSATGTVASGPNGTLAVTLGDLTVASAGTVRVAGTLGVTLDALTATSAGTVLVTGSLGVTLGALTLQSSDNTNFTNGSTTATLGALTVNAAGTVPLLWTPQTPTAAAWTSASAAGGTWTVQTPTSSTWQRAA